MAKAKSVYTCSACGAQFPQWAGQCGDCGAWNTLTEVSAVAPQRSGRFAGFAGDAGVTVTRLSAVRPDSHTRTSVGLQELDRVLGGGGASLSVELLSFRGRPLRRLGRPLRRFEPLRRKLGIELDFRAQYFKLRGLL